VKEKRVWPTKGFQDCVIRGLGFDERRDGPRTVATAGLGCTVSSIIAKASEMLRGSSGCQDQRDDAAVEPLRVR
jgi:hypothetical protein